MKKLKLFILPFVLMFVGILNINAAEVSTAKDLKGCLANDGSVCILANDITLEPEVVGKAKNGNDIYGAITLKGTKTTLNLNGKSLTTVKDDKKIIQRGIIHLEDNAELIVKDTTGKGAITNGQSDTWAAVTVFSGSKLTVENGTLQGFSYGVAGNGSNGLGGTTIVINNGTIIGTGDTTGTLGIYHPQTGTLTVNGGTITGDVGIEIRSGELNVNGGIITGVYKPTTVNANGNGPTTYGAGIAVAQHTTKNAITVNILKGTIKGFTAFYESNPQKNSKSDIEKIKLNIKGGNFETINGGTNAVYSEDFTGFILGGTYNSDLKAYVADKYIVNEKSGQYLVEENKIVETNNKDVKFESEDAFSNDYKLVVTAKNKEEINKVAEKVKNIYSKNSKVKNANLLALYEIDITDGNNIIPMRNGKFTISIAIDESLQKYDTYKVIYVNNNGVEETIDAKLIDGKIVFTTSHLSTYGIVGYNNVASTTVENPNTLDNISLFIVLGSLSLIGVSLSVFKLRKNY